MSKPLVPPGRLDILAQELLRRGLKAHGNPTLRIVGKVMEKHIGQALTETFGPGTAAGDLAKRIVAAAGEVRAEDGKWRD